MFQFGIGGLWGNPIGGNQGTPSGPQYFGTLQDVSLDMDASLVELRGQSQFPDDVAQGNRTIKGKAAFGNIQISIYNALFFGAAITTGIQIIVNSEPQSVPGSGPYTITVTNAATFANDLGVRYASNGKPFVLVSGAPAVGQYQVNETTGVYTFAAADASIAVLISYAYTSATGTTMSVTNRVMGYGPSFEIYLAMPYQGNNGMRLYSCKSSKMSAPLKRDNYEIPDFEFEAYANSAGAVFDMYQVSA